MARYGSGLQQPSLEHDEDVIRNVARCRRLVPHSPRSDQRRDLDPTATCWQTPRLWLSGIMAVRKRPARRRHSRPRGSRRVRVLRCCLPGAITLVAPVGILAATASLALITATFTPWWSGAIIINAVIIYAAWDTAVAQLSAR